MQARPTVVTVFGILNIVFGAMGLVCMPISLLMTFAMPVQGNPFLQAMRDNPLLHVWTYVSGVLGLFGCSVLLAAGIGLLKVKPWARLASIGYGIFAIVAGLIGLVIQLLVMVPLLRDAPSGPAGAAVFGGVVGGVIGGCVGQIYPILLIIFMMRPTVKAAFLSPGDPAESL
ncbi:MAG: hypothetical protein WCR06_07340 [bacterium]